MKKEIDTIIGKRFKQLQKNLERPLVFFDLETTGVSTTKDRIVEMTMIKVSKKGVEDPIVLRVNPEIPIPEEASKVHGIYDKDVEDCKTFSEISKSVAKTLDNCDFAGYNAKKYDVPLLQAEFNRAGVDIDIKNRSVVDPIVIFKQRMRKNLTSALRYYSGKELTDAHSSLSDTLAALEVLSQQLELYEDLPVKLDELVLKQNSRAKNSNDGENKHFVLQENEYHFKFGKHKGKKISDPSVRNYLKWMLKQEPPDDFPTETKKIIKEYIIGLKKKKKSKKKKVSSKQKSA